MGMLFVASYVHAYFLASNKYAMLPGSFHEGVVRNGAGAAALAARFPIRTQLSYRDGSWRITSHGSIFLWGMPFLDTD